MRAREAYQGVHGSCLLGLRVTRLLAGCALWTNSTTPSSVFADDAAACEAKAAQAALTVGQCDLDHDNASTVCLHAKRWTLWGRREHGLQDAWHGPRLLAVTCLSLHTAPRPTPAIAWDSEVSGGHTACASVVALPPLHSVLSQLPSAY
jgi:hypothetical protein